MSQKYWRTSRVKAYGALLDFRGAARPLDERQQPHEQLPRLTGKLNDRYFLFDVSFSRHPVRFGHKITFQLHFLTGKAFPIEITYSSAKTLNS